MAAAFGGSSSGNTEQQAIYGLFDDVNYNLLVGSGATSTSQPRAYLNYLFFDQDFKYIGAKSGYKQVSVAAQQDVNDPNKPKELLTGTITITVDQGGYVYVYLSNESQTDFDVYFDDLRVTHSKGAILQEDHYYPFGANISALSSGAPLSKPNKYKFNGIEENTDFDFNTYDAFYRNYDPILGRWWQVDPKTSERESPYVGMGNSPFMYSDYLGDTIEDKRTKGMNFFVVASKEQRKADIQAHMPKKGPFKKLRAKFSSAYWADNVKARIKRFLSFGKMKVIAADDAKDAVTKIKEKLGDKGYVKNLTIDFHVGAFGDKAFDSKETESALSELSRGFAGEGTTCYLGNCWAGGNKDLGQPDLTAMTSKWLDGATTIGNQSAASSISFFFRSTFDGIIPVDYSTNPGNARAVGNHTVSTRRGSATIYNIVKIKNSGRIKIKRKRARGHRRD